MKEAEIKKILESRILASDEFSSTGYGIRIAYLDRLRMLAVKDKTQIKDLIDQALYDYLVKRGEDVKKPEAQEKPDRIDLGDRVIITPNAAAERLGVRPVTVRHYLREGYLEGIQVGKQWYIDEKALDSFEKPKVGGRRNSK